MSDDKGTQIMSHYDESGFERFARKARKDPFMIVGLCGLVGLVGYGIYGFRSKKIKTSIYLIQLRVAAQGFVVVCLTAGAGFNLYHKFLQPKLFPESIEKIEAKKE